jgi:uncharacterized membrane protein YraQ (UPF0718 family)/copper chaperone CopZ
MYEATTIFVFSLWETLREMAPFLLFGFFVAGILSILIQPEVVERHLGGKGFKQVAKASLFGVPLPLCSCGVIPVAASLRRSGASAGATTSFLVSTPQTGVDSIMVTLSLLGPVFAVYRPIISFVSGVIGGTLVNMFGERENDGGARRPKCVGECCTEAAKNDGFVGAIKYGFITLPRDINKALIIGVIVAGLIAAVVPDDYFASILGGGIVSMLVMMLVGIPIYVCATASVPIAAALIAKGVSPGAALVFLMTGPATNAATITTVWKTMGRRTAGLYLGTVAGASILAGMLLDVIFSGRGSGAVQAMPWMVPGPVKTIAAVALVVVLVGTFFRSSRVGEIAMDEIGARRITIAIKGMSCEHCARSIRRALLEGAGVKGAAVDFKKGSAIVTGDGFDVKQLEAVIESLGYSVTGVDDAGE